MNVTRNGKIARLPREIREQLNRRLQDGGQAKKLVPWPNALPSVRAVIEREFGGRAVREQNISEWRKGGYREWLQQQDAMEAVRRFNSEFVELHDLAGPEISDNAALWLVARYVAAAKRLEHENGGMDWKLMREFCSDLVALRRGDHSNARILIESKRQMAAEQTSLGRFKRRVINGLETLQAYVEKHPEAQAAFDALAAQVRDPMDKIFEE